MKTYKDAKRASEFFAERGRLLDQRRVVENVALTPAGVACSYGRTSIRVGGVDISFQSHADLCAMAVDELNRQLALVEGSLEGMGFDPSSGPASNDILGGICSDYALGRLARSAQDADAKEQVR